MVTSRSNRYENLDGLKVIAALGIVTMHVSSNMGHPLTSELATNIIGSMTHFVKLFLILSGFGMCCGYYEKFKLGTVNLNEFYSKRFAKNLPFFALLVCIDTLLSFKNVLWRDVFISLTMTYNLFPTHDLSIIGVGWTLGTIFVFYFVFPFFVYTIYTKRRSWFTVTTCLLINWCCCNYYKSVNRTDGANFLFLSVYFVIGGILYLYRDSIKKTVSTIPNPIVLMITAIVTVAWYLIDVNEFSVLFTLKTAILFAMWMILAISYPLKLLGNDITKLLSQVSLEVYLSHMMIFRVVEKIGIAVYIDNKNIVYLVVLFSTIVLTIAFSLLVKKVIDICFRKLRRVESRND